MGGSGLGTFQDLCTLWIGSKGTCTEVHEGVAFFVYNGSLDEWEKEHPNKDAFFLANNVLVRSREDLTSDLIDHELAHARQLSKYKSELIYRPVYLLEMLRAKIANGDPYDNRFEQEANGETE